MNFGLLSLVEGSLQIIIYRKGLDMKKRIIIVCIVFVAFLFASSVFASTGSWTPSFTSANKEKYMYGVSGTLKKYVSYAKGTITNQGTGTETFRARFGSAYTNYTTANGIPIAFNTEPTFSNSTVKLGFYRLSDGTTFNGTLYYDLR